MSRIPSFCHKLSAPFSTQRRVAPVGKAVEDIVITRLAFAYSTSKKLLGRPPVTKL